ncbi:hypothetical protein ACEWY4_001218 [Coilia grayii]|uniref:Gypsy retrotransposon integrase-like protein 1 n=1 Tax=Coilia grayii TaxID=363190 RepID=A0ABD1KYV9_9TELE
MKSERKDWEIVTSANPSPECEQVLELLTCVSRWMDLTSEGPISMVKLSQAITLLPKQENLVWGKLLSHVIVSPGSTVKVGPTVARLVPQNILDKLDCGEAKDSVHRIHLTDCPFRLPHRGIPPAHYHKLREVLSEMEEKGITRKSINKYASPLVMVWKKNGDLRIYTDCRCLNAKTVKDAHHLPHQSDCLAALGGEQKRRGRLDRKHKRTGTYRELSPGHWTPACEAPFEDLKRGLMTSVVLAHPNFSKPFILCMDDSLDILGTALSQVLDGEEKARSIAFASLTASSDHLTSLENCGQETLLTWSKDELRALQLQDATVSIVVYYVDWTLRQLRPDVLASVHDLAGHQGQPHKLSLARQRFFWYDMDKNIRNHVKTCRRCILSKTPELAARAPLQSMQTFTPLELVCINFWSAEDKNKSMYVPVITDHFTKLAHTFPCQDQTAKGVAKKLWDNFFYVYLLRMQSHTSPYHPMASGSLW